MLGKSSKKEEIAYGAFWLKNKSRPAHRLALAFHLNVPLEELEEVMHSCDNPSCCNPYHLENSTHINNTKDMHLKKRRIAEKGEDRYNAKLTEEKVKKIKRLTRLRKKYSKYTTKYFAEKYDVSPSLIRKINENKAWNHIKE